MSVITVIGDVHGKATTYQKIVRRLPLGQRSVQIGDMGIGFPGVGLHRMADEHKWFRGNHDHPAKCRLNHNYMGDWGFLKEDSLFWVAGAWSIDKDYRIPGVSWWEDEELSYETLQTVIDSYAKEKPRFVLSHECPARAGRALLDDLVGPYFSAKGDCCNSRTSAALQQMFESHQPERWIFGHYHVNKTFQLANAQTQFQCLGELQTCELDTANQ